MKKVIQKVKDRLPEWVYRVDADYQTVLSDDIDGLISTNLLKRNCNWTTEYFYNFDGLYVTDEFLEQENKQATRVWADIAWVMEGRDEKTFDNHVCRVDEADHINPNMVNPNIQVIGPVSNNNYYEKYSASTALMIWSIYDNDIPISYEGKMVLMCIDGGFKGYYADDVKFQHSFMFSMLKFGFDSLYDFVAYHEKSSFYQFIEKHKLSSKIWINEDGYLETDLDIAFLSEALEMEISLPNKHFNKLVEFEKHGVLNTYGVLRTIRDLGDPVTVAFVGKNKVKYSTLKHC